MYVKSPVTYSGKTNIVEQFSSQKIIELYKGQGIDVKRFFQGIDKIDLYECVDTGYRFYYPERIFGDDLFYQDLYRKIPGYYHVNRWEHKEAKKLIPKNTKLLEVGCGDGFFLELVKDICSQIKGLELNSEAINTGRKKGIDIEGITIQEFAKHNEKKFDVVCCFQVLEHIYDIQSFLDAMIKCIKPGGLLLIAVPNNNPFIFKWDKNHCLNLPPHHAGLWNKFSLLQLQSFFPIKVKTIAYEPLVELKMWYKTQTQHYTQETPVVGFLLKLVPRQVYKPIMRLFKHKIEGKTIMAVYNV